MFKLDSFKQLLLRKALGNDALTYVINSVDSDTFSDLVTEALEKMSWGSHDNKGSGANNALKDFASEITPRHASMFRDYLGHHVSNYKAALAAGDKERANYHAQRFMDGMNLLTSATNHAGGNLKVDAPNMHAWQQWAYPDKKPGNPKEFVTQSKGFNYNGKKRGFDWLQYGPHPDKNGEKQYEQGNFGGYPFHKIKINGKHLPIEDVPTSAQKDHEFDSHPIFEHYRDGVKKEDPKKVRSPERDAQYRKDAAAWTSDQGPLGSWTARMRQVREIDPERYKRHSDGEQPAPVHSKTINPPSHHSDQITHTNAWLWPPPADEDEFVARKQSRINAAPASQASQVVQVPQASQASPTASTQQSSLLQAANKLRAVRGLPPLTDDESALDYLSGKHK